MSPPCHLSLSFLKLSRCHACETTEVFGEERGISKVHLFGYLRCRLICVAQFYFDSGDEGTVNPLLRRSRRECGGPFINDVLSIFLQSYEKIATKP